MEKYKTLELLFKDLIEHKCNPTYITTDFRTGKTTLVGKYASENPDKIVAYYSTSTTYTKNAVDTLSKMFNITNLKSIYNTFNADVVFIEYPNNLDIVYNAVRSFPKAKVYVFMLTSNQI